MTIGALLPIMALVTKSPWMSMDYLDFLWRWWVLVIATILPIGFIKISGWFRPKDVPLISWEALVFHVVRWPWALAGCISGVISSVLKSGYTFHITPKGKDVTHPLGITTILPYIFLIFMSGYATLAVTNAGSAEGYRFLAFLDTVVYTLVLCIVVFLHFSEVPDTRSKLSGIPGLASSISSLLLVAFATFNIMPATINVMAATQSASTGGSVSTETYVGVRTQLGPTPTAPPEPGIIENIVELVLPTPTPDPVVELPKEMLSGMYDPARSFDDFGFNLRHQFVDWNYPNQMETAITEAQHFSQFPMITVEPRVKDGLLPNDLLRDIAAGKYDQEIIEMAEVLNKFPNQKVIVRFAHEMDLCTLYEWATCNAVEFKPAWIHVVSLVREQGAENALWLWSPAGGNPNTNMFYPGGEYVDYVGITALSSEDWDNFFGYSTAPRSLETILNERYKIAEDFDKPFIISELGISYHDPNVDRTKWLTDAFNIMKDPRFSRIVGWAYFNDLNKSNPRITILPDFRLTRDEIFNALVNSGGVTIPNGGQNVVP